jgi:uncharacterized protein
MRMMIAVGTIAQLWRYPVKSMGGEALDTAELTSRGVRGDRAYALLDRDTGKVASAKHPRLWGRLLACRAAEVASTSDVSAAATPAARITLPDGRVVQAGGEVGSEAADEALSALVGRAVALSTQPPPRPEIERYWPDIAGLDLRDTVTAGAIGAGSPAGTFFDYAPLHLMTTASLARLRALYSGGAVAIRRFRPNLVVALSDETAGFVENEWVGRTLVIGEHVRLRVVSPAPRCIVPTLPQPDLPRDVGILRAIVAHNKIPIPPLGGALQASLGVYAAVERADAIHIGDRVRLARGV